MMWKSFFRCVVPLGFLLVSSNLFAQSAPDAPKVKAQLPAVTDINEILNATNQTVYWSRPVRFTGLKVQKVLDPQLILVGPDEKRALPVMLNQSQGDLRKGSTIDVAGMIQQLGPDLQQWNVREPARRALRNYSIFISALKVDAR
jgi:hypothetical protein